MKTPDPLDPIDVESTPGPSGPSKRTAFIGALVGMTALAGTLVGVGAIASAQEDPAPTDTSSGAESDDNDPSSLDVSDADFEAFDACMAEQLGDLWVEPEILFEEFDDAPFDPADEHKFVDAEAVCTDLLPEEIQAQIAAWAPYEECISEAIGDQADLWADGEEPTDADWEAHEDAWAAADDACSELLPADIQVDLAAWEAFDDCLGDAGVLDESFDSGSIVHIETGDGFQVVEFGDTEGSVTITGTEGDLTVTSTGGVTVIDEEALDAQWQAFDEAHQACEDLLPDDIHGGFGFGAIEVFEGDFEGELHD